jgi:molybdopterin converting factor small subunit
MTASRMQVEIRVFATLRQYVPDMPLHSSYFMEVEEGTTMAQIRDCLGLPEKEVKLVMRNFRQADFDEAAAPGDRIAFIPAAAGG